MSVDVQMLGWVLRTGGTILAVVIVLKFMVASTVTEWFRQRMFATRRALFVMVSDGRLDPEEPAYVYTRERINSLLQFAESVTLSRLLIGTFFMREEAIEYGQRIEKMIADVNDRAVRQELRNCWKHIGDVILEHVVLRSPFLLFAALVISLMVGGVRIAAAKILSWGKFFAIVAEADDCSVPAH
jgi:hypothetical protein